MFTSPLYCYRIFIYIWKKIAKGLFWNNASRPTANSRSCEGCTAAVLSVLTGGWTSGAVTWDTKMPWNGIIEVLLSFWTQIVCFDSPGKRFGINFATKLREYCLCLPNNLIISPSKFWHFHMPICSYLTEIWVWSLLDSNMAETIVVCVFAIKFKLGFKQSIISFFPIFLIIAQCK